MVICLEQGADLQMAQLMPLPLTVSCSSKIQIGFTFLVQADLGTPGKRPLNRCVCVCMKLTGHVAVLWCGREVQVTEEVENVSFDRYAGWRHRLCDWRRD